MATILFDKYHDKSIDAIDYHTEYEDKILIEYLIENPDSELLKHIDVDLYDDYIFKRCYETDKNSLFDYLDLSFIREYVIRYFIQSNDNEDLSVGNYILEKSDIKDDYDFLETVVEYSNSFNDRTLEKLLPHPHENSYDYVMCCCIKKGELYLLNHLYHNYYQITGKVYHFDKYEFADCIKSWNREGDYTHMVNYFEQYQSKLLQSVLEDEELCSTRFKKYFLWKHSFESCPTCRKDIEEFPVKIYCDVSSNCSICLEKVENPHVLIECGHVYCEKCIY